MTGARGVDELGAADRDPDVGRPATGGRKEDEIPGLDVSSIDAPAELVLLGDRARHRDLMLFVDVPDETAAIEASAGFVAAKSIPHASQRQRRLHQQGGFWGNRPRNRWPVHTRRAGKWRRSRAGQSGAAGTRQHAHDRQGQ